MGHGLERKRGLRFGLAGLWCIDAGLQAQPGMFHRAFYGELPDSLMPSTLQTVHDSSAPFVEPIISFTEHLYEHAPYVMNAFVILLQLFIGVSLFLVKSTRTQSVILLISVVWALCIWIFGEGLSGLFVLGSMNYYTGFPGSAIVYAFASLLLIASDKSWLNGSVYIWATRSVSILLLICAVLQVIPQDGNWQQETQMSLFGNSGSQTQPSILSGPIMDLTDWIFVGRHAVLMNWLETALLVYSGAVTWYWQSTSSWLRGFLYLWLFATWWFGMDFGFLFSGLSTDLNTAPILWIVMWSQSPGLCKKLRRGTVSFQSTQ